MSKKLFVVMLVLLGVLTTNVFAEGWTGAGVNNLWTNPQNWSAVPHIPYTANINSTVNPTNWPLIDSTMAADAGQVGLNGTDPLNRPKLTMTGGTLQLGGGEAFKIGHGVGTQGIFEMHGGILSAAPAYQSDCQLFVGGGGETGPNSAYGEFTMYGGVASFSYGKIGNRYFATAGAHLNMYGGTLNMGGLELRPWARANITNGTIVINGNRESTVDSWVSGGQLVAFGGAGTIQRHYDGTVTTITAIPEPVTIALLGLGGLFIRRRRN